MPTYTHTWTGGAGDNKLGALGADADVVFMREGANLGTYPFAGSYDPSVFRGFYQINLATLSIPSDETVVSAVLSRTMTGAAGNYKIVGANNLDITVSDSEQDHWDSFTGSTEYQDTPDNTDGVIATTLNAAGISDLQTQISGSKSTFMMAVVLDDEGDIGAEAYHDGNEDCSFVITTEAAPSSSIKTLLGVARADVKTIGGLAIASVKSVVGLE